MKTRSMVLGCLLALMLVAAPAWACPRCQLGVDVRRAIFGDAFWTNFASMALPFALALAFTRLVYKAVSGDFVANFRSKE